MANIDFELEKFDELNEKLKQTKNKMNSSRTVAATVGDVDGVNWKEITNNLNECKEVLDKYSIWVTDTYDNLNKLTKESMENINNIEIEEIIKKQFCVK